jgi:hypothetical protein
MARRLKTAGEEMTNFAASFDVLKGKGWPRDAGSKVTEAQLAAAAAVLTRHGTAKHLGLAMYLRPEGATQNQVFAVTGDTQVNVARDLIAAGKARPVNMPATGKRKVYKLALTGKASKAKPAAKATGKGKGTAKATTAKRSRKATPQPAGDAGTAS